MKKILFSLFLSLILLAQPCTTSAEEIVVTITTDEDFQDTGGIIQQMQTNLGKLLTEINAANSQNRTLNVAGLALSDDAKSTLVMLWDNIHFYCDDSEVVDRCWPLQNGYMLRQIPLIMNPQGESFGHGNYQEAVVTFDKRGRIIDFNFVFDSQIGESLERCAMGGQAVVELERKMKIMSYVDRFRTAYCTKDIKFLQQVFSDDALIITGNVITTKSPEGGMATKVQYKKQGKQEYLANLRRAFARNKYIDVKFSEIGDGGVEGGCGTVTRSSKNPNMYGVRLHQAWRSSNYNDDGYVFLLWDFTDENAPVIHVRTWQPEYLDKNKTKKMDSEEIFSLSDFDL
ncbi:MAG: hypothetical protein IJ533_02840 [Prevotella sp.]|nr:hypothetical protein [Prevotella sp.]